MRAERNFHQSTAKSIPFFDSQVFKTHRLINNEWDKLLIKNYGHVVNKFYASVDNSLSLKSVD